MHGHDDKTRRPLSTRTVKDKCDKKAPVPVLQGHRGCKQPAAFMVWTTNTRGRSVQLSCEIFEVHKANLSRQCSRHSPGASSTSSSRRSRHSCFPPRATSATRGLVMVCGPTHSHDRPFANEKPRLHPADVAHRQLRADPEVPEEQLIDSL